MVRNIDIHVGFIMESVEAVEDKHYYFWDIACID